jgi:hypothetical protein
MLVLIGVRSPREALFGALVLATGLPVYESLDADLLDQEN